MYTELPNVYDLLREKMDVLSKLKALKLCSLQISFTYIISCNAQDSVTLYVIYLSYK